METRILAEMKTENRRKIFFPWKKIDKHTFFYENLADGYVNGNWRYKTDIHHEFSVLDFFKFASRMSQIDRF